MLVIWGGKPVFHVGSPSFRVTPWKTKVFFLERLFLHWFQPLWWPQFSSMQLWVLPLTWVRLLLKGIGIKRESGIHVAGWGSAAGKTGLNQPWALRSMFEGSLTKVILTLSVSLPPSLPRSLLPVFFPPSSSQLYIIPHSLHRGYIYSLFHWSRILKVPVPSFCCTRGKKGRKKKKTQKGKKVLVFSSCELLLTLSTVPITQ